MIAPAVCDIVAMPAPVIDHDPPPFDNVFVYVVVPACEYVCNSFVVLPSTSVAVIVNVPAVCDIVLMPPALIVNEPPPFDNVFVYDVVPE